MGHLIICLGARIQWTYSIYGVPCLVSIIPRNSLCSVGSAACSVWDLLPAFCGICCLPFVELSLLRVGHTAILLWNLLYSVGPAAYFLWDSLPAFDGNHYLFPMNRLLPVSTGPVTPLPPVWTNVRPHPHGTSCPSVPRLASVEPTASLLRPPSISSYLAKFAGL